MIIEGISLNKKCFYADPNSSLSCFYGNLPNLNQILLKDYKTFEDKILNSLLGNSNIPNPIEKKDEICLKSDEVSDRIYNFLKNSKDINIKSCPFNYCTLLCSKIEHL